jgi:hypothetical protein
MEVRTVGGGPAPWSDPPPESGLHPAEWLQRAFSSVLLILAWSFFCLYPAYWHATMNDGLWSHLNQKWHVGTGPLAFFYPLSDVIHWWRFPVHNAALMNRSEDVRQGIADQPDRAKVPDNRGRTALEYATFMGHFHCAEFLVKAGAPLETTGIRDTTPLMLALANGQWHTVALLLDHGARIDVVDAVGVGAIHRAAALGFSKVVTAAVAGGISLESKDRQGRTPMDYAVLANNLPMVMELAMAGVAPETSINSRNPLIPLYLALCRKTDDPHRAARLLAEQRKDSPAELLKNSFRLPAELPIDDRPVSLR